MVSILKHHVVALPFPTQGHLSPMFHVCKRLSAEGVRVSYIVPSSIHEQMKNLNTLPSEMDLHIEFYPFEMRIPHGMDMVAAFYEPARFIRDLKKAVLSLENMFESFAAKGVPVSYIISDSFLPCVEKLAANTGIRGVSFWPGSARWAACDLHAKELLEFHSGSINLPGLPTLSPEEVPRHIRTEGSFENLLLDRAQRLKMDTHILVNTFDDLEDFTLDALKDKLIPIGPLILIDGNNSRSEGGAVQNLILREENQECIDWLAKQKKQSVLYISFGSFAPLIVQQFEELAAALESSRQPFLWVVRLDLFMNFDDEFKMKYEGFTERTKEYGMIISWGSQLRILQQESTGGFLTHCGWNSTLESICYGVPLIGWPWAGDQFINCQLLAEEWKIGVALPTNEVVRSGVIVECIDKVMSNGEEYRLNIKRLKDLAAKAADPSGKSARNLDKFIKKLVSDLSAA